MFTAFHHGSHFTDENIFTSLLLEKLPSNDILYSFFKIVNLEISSRLRNFTFGFNWIEFTHDALIKYQAMTCGFTLLHVPFFCKAYLPNRADSGLVLLGALLGRALTPVKDTATCGAKHP